MNHTAMQVEGGTIDSNYTTSRITLQGTRRQIKTSLSSFHHDGTVATPNVRTIGRVKELHM
jgi:hypothetical protein